LVVFAVFPRLAPWSEQIAVLRWFQFRGFDLAAGFQLRGELIMGELVAGGLLGLGVAFFVADEV